MNYAILIGGPRDGDQRAVSPEITTIETVMLSPPRLQPGPQPRPPWWHPFRRRRWRPPPLPGPPEMIQVSYRADGTRRDGMRVFRVADGWQPFRGPVISLGSPLYHALVDAQYAVHPAIRIESHCRWVMDLDWYKQVRRLAASFDRRAGEDEEKWKPDPSDLLLGMPVTVTADGGLPHLENPRYPAEVTP